jgi:uncharacterized protein (DUF305 family)
MTESAAIRTTSAPRPKQARGLAGGMIAAWGLVSLGVAAAPAPLGPEAEYAAGMHQIMERMSADMTMTPNDAVDRQFITLMIPHHQAAIDMARLQLRYGHDVRLSRLAQEIIVEQQQEIEVMRNVMGVAQ